MSSLDNLVDQENRPLGGGPLGRRGKAVVEAEPVRSRSVLGDISQNVRRQPPRHISNKSQGSFSIFSDVEAGLVKLSSRTQGPAAAHSRGQVPAAALHSALADKENAPPKDAKVAKYGEEMLRTQTIKGHEDLRAQQTRTVQLLHQQETRTVQLLHQQENRTEQLINQQENRTVQLINHVHEPMNTSVDVESPMVVESEVVQCREQWRVPPIKDHKTVDIFTEPEYFQDIYRYLKESELKHLPKWNYMSKQVDITHSMRSILVDWLVEVGEEYKLQTETLHLAVNYIDRFLSCMAVQRSKLQLVGAACMFIAAKYEEIYPPDVSEFVYITDDTYNKKQVLRMEHLVLKVLGFDLNVPTTFLFANKMCEMERQQDPELRDRLPALSAYLVELSLVDGETFLRFTPSLVAAAAVALARHTLELDAWPASLYHKTGYSLEELKECFVCLHTCFTKAEAHAQQAVREKYKTQKYFNVADLSSPSIF